MELFKVKDREKSFKNNSATFANEANGRVANGKAGTNNNKFYAKLAQNSSQTQNGNGARRNQGIAKGNITDIPNPKGSNGKTNFNDIYTYFDKKEGTSATHEKKALKEIDLTNGGKGTDNKGFRASTIEFIDDTRDFVEAVRVDDNEAAASHMDDKASALFKHGAKRHTAKSKRYGEIAKSAKIETKQLEKEKKDEKSKRTNTTENGIDMYFNNTGGTFADSEDVFGGSIGDSFKSHDEIKIETLFNNDNDGNMPTGSVKGHTTTGKIEGRFEKAYVNEKAKLESKFESRNMTRQEKIEQGNSIRNSGKKSESKEVRKAASMAAASKFFETKKYMQNQSGDMSGETSGDLLKDGSMGMMQAMTDTVRNAVINATKRFIANAAKVAKNAGLALLKWAVAAFPTIIAPASVLLLLLIVVNVLVMMVTSVFGGDNSEDYDLNVNGDGYVYASLSEEDIEGIIEAINDNYGDISAEQETAIRYALSKVGCEYNQDYHASLTDDIFDCSSLTYRSYISAGVDISNDGIYTAAEECRAMEEAGNTVTGDMKPGDLIFYGGSDNGRYKGIYHVAIYVGRVNGVDKMVEARGKDYGVVYCDVRKNNVVNISRPY